MKKTLKNCPVHGSGANGLGCYCKRKAPKWILDIIAEENAKWKDHKDKFGVGVRAGIESIKYRINEG